MSRWRRAAAGGSVGGEEGAIGGGVWVGRIGEGFEVEAEVDERIVADGGGAGGERRVGEQARQPYLVETRAGRVGVHIRRHLGPGVRRADRGGQRIGGGRQLCQRRDRA